jgi:hypothetical protein
VCRSVAARSVGTEVPAGGGEFRVVLVVAGASGLGGPGYAGASPATRGYAAASPATRGYAAASPATRGYAAASPESGVVRRHHLHGKVYNEAIKRAAREAGIEKQVTSHALRQNAESREMPSWAN